MKRSLVVGCAAIALATVSGSASADTKFEVLLGGDAFFQGAYVDQDNDQGLRSTEFTNRVRVTLTPKATTDSGLEYGAHVRLVAGGDNTTINGDRAYIFLNGSFGTVHLGMDTGLSDGLANIGPNDEGIAGGPDNGTLAFYVGDLPAMFGNLRAVDTWDNGTKISYFSPTFSGFQLAAAYTPQFGDVNQSVNRVKNSAFYNDMVEVGALYSGEFGAVTLDLNAFYAVAEAQTGVEDLETVQVGGTLGFGAFKVGGTYVWGGDSGYATGTTGVDDLELWSVGLQYDLAPVILAASYTRATGASLGGFDSKADLWQAGVTYNIAPGLTTGLEYSFLDNKIAASKDEAHIIMVDTRLAF